MSVQLLYAHFKKVVFHLFMLVFVRLLIYHGYNSFANIHFVNIFSQSVACLFILFILLMEPFDEQGY